MDSLDLFFKKYAYKFPKGYPDLTNEQDINLLADILENMGINLKEQPTPEENLDDKIKQLISSLDDNEIKKKIIKVLVKANKKEDIYDEEEVKESKDKIIEKLKGTKNLASNYSNIIYRMSLDFNEYKNLVKYLENPTINNIPEEGTLMDLFSTIPLSDKFKKELIEIYGRSTGKGEIALITFIDGCTARGGKKDENKKGDIILNGKNIEVKQGQNFQLSPFEISRYGIKPSNFLKKETGLDFARGESWPITLQKYWEEEKVNVETINKILKEFYGEQYVEKINENTLKSDNLLNYITNKLVEKYIEESKSILLISIEDPYNFKLINSLDDYNKVKKSGRLKISAFTDEFPRFSYS